MAPKTEQKIYVGIGLDFETGASGFKLNLGLFSIGRKKTMEKSFSTYDYQRSQDAYGELNIEFRRALYMCLF